MVRLVRKIAWTGFLLFGFGFAARLWAYPSVTIQNAQFVSFSDSPMHHGLEVETTGISDPNLTTYEVQVKPDSGGPFPSWKVYSTRLLPHHGRLLNIPYRNGILALKTGTQYCVRVRSVYGETVTSWAERCRVTVPSSVGGANSDEDGDGLTEAAEYALGTDPRNGDTDGDGRTDGTEVTAGTDPHHGQLLQLIIRTPSIDFGEGNAFGARRNQHRVIEVENVGDEAAQIERVEIVEGHPAESQGFFHLGSYSGTITNIPPQNKIFIPISFIPNRRGEAVAQVRIASNNPTPLPSIPLRGVGGQIPDCSVLPEALDFGTVEATAQEVTVQDVTLANRPFPGDVQPPNNDNTPWGFTLSTTDPEMAPGLRGFVLEKDEEIRIPVLFQHSSVGDHTSSLDIRSFHCGIQRVRLTGRAE